MSSTTIRSGLLAACAAVAIVHCGREPARAGFWFENVSFVLPPTETAQLGGPIRNEEKQRIQSVAWSELKAAFAGLALNLSGDHTAFYRVAVVQDTPDVSRLSRGAAGESHVLGPLGGGGSVSFFILAKNAIYYAPPAANRAAIIDGIGRGIGRAATHEFAHQILRDVAIDATRDRDSYEYGSADRAVQYYGALHWDGAWGALVKKLGR